MVNLKEKELISLKEAAKVSGYSADYIGQLIRAGKIPGKQVYMNIAWMTTAEAVINYKNKGKEEQKNPTWKTKIADLKGKLGMEVALLRLVMKNFKSAVPLLVLMFVIFGALLYSLFFFANNSKINKNNSNSDINKTNLVEF